MLGRSTEISDFVLLPPKTLTDNQSSTLPVAAFVNWFSLVEYGYIKAGDKVLVQGTGGMSIFAIQIASALGAKVIVTSSSDEKLEKAKELGASHFINYKNTLIGKKKCKN